MVACPSSWHRHDTKISSSRTAIAMTNLCIEPPLCLGLVACAFWQCCPCVLLRLQRELQGTVWHTAGCLTRLLFAAECDTDTVPCCSALQHSMSSNYLPIVDQKFPASHAAHLHQQLEAITALYAVVCCNGNLQHANSILRKQQQEQVSFQRNSIWKDMVGQERRAATVRVQVSLCCL